MLAKLLNICLRVMLANWIVHALGRGLTFVLPAVNSILESNLWISELYAISSYVRCSMLEIYVIP
jgi:hypothetical protein